MLLIAISVENGNILANNIASCWSIIYRKKGRVVFDNVLHNGIERLICLCLCQLNCKKQF